MEGNEEKQTAEEMAKIWINILTAVSRQGFSIILLVAISYYFQLKNDKLEAKVDGCIDNQVEQYRNRSERAEKLLERSTLAVEAFSLYLKDSQAQNVRRK